MPLFFIQYFINFVVILPNNQQIENYIFRNGDIAGSADYWLPMPCVQVGGRAG